MYVTCICREVHLTLIPTMFQFTTFCIIHFQNFEIKLDIADNCFVEISGYLFY